MNLFHILTYHYSLYWTNSSSSLQVGLTTRYIFNAHIHSNYLYYLSCPDVCLEKFVSISDDGTDDTDSKTDTTISPVTDSVNTGVPTAGPSSLCYAVGEWANLAYMDGWCNFHCLHPMINFCPATHCLCGSGVSSRNW